MNDDIRREFPFINGVNENRECAVNNSKFYMVSCHSDI